jgi:hypothetical protein
MQNKKIILPDIYNFLRPKQTENLARFGVKKDGGYIVDMTAINRVNHLISFGMADEYSFENDFLKNNKNNTLQIYDFSVNHKYYLIILFKVLRRFLTFRKSFEQLILVSKNYFKFLKFVNNKRVKFYPKKITNIVNKDNEVNLEIIFNNLESLIKSVGLKIDIEGDEYKIVDDITKNSSRINFLIIEFHWIERNIETFINNVKKINKFFDIIHLHGNNHGKIADNGLPDCLEITFVNKSNNLNYINYPKNLPIENLDYPNNPFEKDININFN